MCDSSYCLSGMYPPLPLLDVAVDAGWWWWEVDAASAGIALLAELPGTTTEQPFGAESADLCARVHAKEQVRALHVGQVYFDG